MLLILKGSKMFQNLLHTNVTTTRVSGCIGFTLKIVQNLKKKNRNDNTTCCFCPPSVHMEQQRVTVRADSADIICPTRMHGDTVCHGNASPCSAAY